METSIVTVKGQIVVPVKIRRRFGIKKGTRIAFIEQNGKLMIQPLDKNYLSGRFDYEFSRHTKEHPVTRLNPEVWRTNLRHA